MSVQRRMLAACVAWACVLLGGCSHGAEKLLDVEHLRWVDVAGISVPEDPSGPGPLSVTGEGVARGYEHSKAGAVLAAIGLPVRLAAASDDHWPVVVSETVKQSKLRDQWILARAEVSVDTADTDAGMRFVAVQLIDYSDTTAKVDVFSRYQDGSLTKQPTSLEWLDEQWKLVLSDAPEDEVSVVAGLPDEAVRLVDED